MAIWHEKHGKWWMLQWCFDWWFSFGIHIDFRRRKTGDKKIPYGPYFDIHFGWLVLSLGYHPYWSGEVNCLLGRGGERGDDIKEARIELRS